MTNEHAISLLKAVRGMIEWDEPMEYAAAIDMAVEALTNAHDTNADIISRRSVLDLIRTFPSEEYNSKLLYQSVMQMPSAQPERKTGKWIPVEDREIPYGLLMECSKCKNRIIINDALEHNYCSECGADMRSGRE